MKRVLLFVVLVFLSMGVAHADMLSDLLSHKDDKIGVYHYGRKLGISDTVVEALLEMYDYWYKEGRRAARKDMEIMDVYRTYDAYKEGTKYARETGERTSECVNPRYKDMFYQVPRRGFAHGYYSIYNPNLKIMND